MRRADAIIANAPMARSTMQSAYPECAEKIVTITNGYDAEAMPAPKAHDPGPGRKISVLHAGELYYGRDPRPLLDALCDLEQEQPGSTRNLSVRFVGAVTAKSFELGFDLLQEIRQRGLTDVVTVEGWTPYNKVLREMAASDILLMLDTPGRRVGIPAKAYEYIGVGRPILALSEQDGDVAWLLQESGIRHRIAAPQDRVQIKNCLMALVNQIVSGGFNTSDANRLGRFTREYLAGTLAKVLRHCLDRPWVND